MNGVIYKTIGLGRNLWSLAAPQQAARAAGHFFSTPPNPSLRGKDHTFLDSARKQHRFVAEQNIIEYHWGPEQGPLVILSYGWGYNAGRWRYFVPELTAAGFRVLAYDPPGHGLVPVGRLNIPLNAAIIRTLLEIYGPAEAIIGHSFGGSSSVYALQHLPQHLHPRRMAVMASFSYAPRVFDEYQKTLGLWPSLYWRMVRAFEQQVGHPMEHYDFAMMTSALAHIEALLVHSPGDAVTPYAEARRYHNFWPESRLFSPQEGGHHLGTPGITRAVLDFIVAGQTPAQTERQERPLNARHELAPHFAGL
ncbi:MAG: alpha/beta fold hydrolase [Lewinellaceae bacterium]|nr:alpha/beta fold hydrolase [Lewinellaceae bacterium]